MMRGVAVRVYFQMTLRESKWGARESIDVGHRVRESVQVILKPIKPHPKWNAN